MNKRSFNLPKDDQGFALITVLIISFLGSLIVFDTIQENLNQERMAGNYSKALNARLQAENGLAEVYNMLSADSNLSTEDMMAQLNSNQNNSGGYYHSINAWLDNDIREVNSSGFHFEGQSAMRGSMTVASGNDAFNSAITTCDGVTLGGSGKIDSYDGEYDASNAGNEGDVTILNEDASGLNLTGGTSISGDVSSNGDLSITNGYIYGDAHVSGNVTVGNSQSASVSGSIEATGDVSYSYTGDSYITESINSNGDVSIGYSSFTGDITFGGDQGGTLWSANDSSTFSSITMMTSDHVNAVATQNCDILALAEEFKNETNGIGSLANSEATIVSFGWPTNEYIISDSGLKAYDKTWNVKDWVDVETQLETVDFLGEDTIIHVLDIENFNDNTLSLTVESGSNITIYLADSTFFGGSIKVQDGASLTIITKDKINLDSDGTITNQLDLDGDGIYETESTASVNSNGEISTIIYSGYDSSSNDDFGISVAGGNSSAFTAYAPAASINVSEGGDIFGSLRSDYLSITGGAGIHFDQNISDASIGNSGSASSIEITRWF